jgi:uncharacterized membrane protein
MNMTFSNLTLIVAAVTTALMAGLFFSWSVSVTPGLARISTPEYLIAFQAMNRAILNPVFLSCFMGTVFLLPLATYLQYSPSMNISFWFLLAASACYIVGVFGVTMAGNVPLNEMLDRFQIEGASMSAMEELRDQFETLWNKLNMVRTVCSISAVTFVILACLNLKR